MFSDGRPDVLPRGRHRLSRRTVESVQRSRIIQGTVEAVGQDGYGALTVTEITRRARVARGVFYREFENKDAALFAACDQAGESLLEHLYRVGESHANWVEGLRAGTEALIAWLQQNGAAARMLYVEMPAVGEAGHEHRDRLLGRYEELIAAVATRARHEEPELAPRPAWVPQLIVRSVVEAVAVEIRKGRLRELHERADMLLYLQVALIADTDHARRATP